MLAHSSTIAIGCDHAGYAYREAIIEMLSANYKVLDFGTKTADSVDYPDFAHAVSRSVVDGSAQIGILLCGTANGVAMTANKYPEIRAGIAWTSEIATYLRLHNDANILCIPARFTAIEQAKEIVTTFITTTFEGGRHERRVNKICL
jgi:ribose 5-phosphate isomerase B